MMHAAVPRKEVIPLLFHEGLRELSRTDLRIVARRSTPLSAGDGSWLGVGLRSAPCRQKRRR